jgi:hypothetical protein
LNKGTIPDGNITWPTPTNFTISNTGLNNFSSNVASSMTYRESVWDYYSSAERFMVNWIVYSPSATQLAYDNFLQVTYGVETNDSGIDIGILFAK